MTQYDVQVTTNLKQLYWSNALRKLEQNGTEFLRGSFGTSTKQYRSFNGTESELLRSNIETSSK